MMASIAMRFLGLDVGTSFLKSGLLDLDRLCIGDVRRVAFPPSNDPSVIVTAVRSLISGSPRVDGMVFCGQMHGLMLANRKGEALAGYIPWSDLRAEGCFEELRALLTPDESAELGSELRPSLPISFLYWMTRHGSLPADAIPCSLADFVIANLCRAAPVAEPTSAAALGAFNLATGDWHRGVIEKLGLAGLCWPALKRAGEVAGLLDGVPCYAAVGDHQCAVAGVLLEEGELSLNISTGSQVAAIAPSFAPAEHQTRPYFDGRFLKTVTHIPAGRALNALVRLLTELGGEDDPWPRIEAAARLVESTDLRAGIAFFAGACGARGSLANLHEGNLTVGHLFRAAYESMARNYESCAARIAGSEPWRRLVFSGGLALRSELLRGLILERFRLPWRLAPAAEDTLNGLLLVALVAGGRRPTLAAATAALAPGASPVCVPRPE